MVFRRRPHFAAALGALCLALTACGSDSITDADAPQGPPFELVEPTSEKGWVNTVVQAGPYTYVAYGTEDGEERWLATLRTTAEVGETVTVKRYGEREAFYSSRLDRTFDTLHFGHFSVETETP